jgi:hypothetical protein
VDEEQPKQSKSIFKTKTFWVNLLSGAIEVGQLLTGTNIVPSGYLMLGVNAANIVLRRVTSEEVHVVTPRPVEQTPAAAPPVD